MNKPRKTLLASAMAIAMLTGAPAMAQDGTDASFQTHFHPDTILVEPASDAAFDAAVDLIVTGPDGFRHRESYPAGALIEFSPATLADKPLADGVYVWELRVMSIGETRTRGIDSDRPAAASPFDSSHGGVFSVRDGQLVSPEVQEETPAPKASSAMPGTESEGGITPQQVISGDLTVYNSLCVGTDCLAQENYGFDTQRLKENNLRIHFADTSNSGSFPTNDWRLVANDSANGGQNRFSIEDADAGRAPFTIEAGARNHALYIDDGGRMGLGTSTPAVEIHSADGDTPTMRLEQTGASGFTPQTWDIAGNEANFFVRDVTNGSQLPFRIQPGAPSSAIYVANSGKVGMGAGTSPAEPLHIKRSDNTAKLLIEDTGAGTQSMLSLVNNGYPLFNLEDTSQTDVNWIFRLSGEAGTTERFTITKAGTGQAEFELFHDGSANFLGDVTANGVLLTSTREAKTDFHEIDEREILERLASLEISGWRYKHEDEQTVHIGPVAEEFQAVFGLSDGRRLNMIDTTGIAFAAIKALDSELGRKQDQVDELSAKVARLERLVEQLAGEAGLD
ncbi:MAG: hypothetical protein GVY32_01220 [Gammaproteobacteria bacterium]|jgi:hypothetical protein|nr:hypothetical protein [Gammaproteobacteria bacterium]